MIALLDPARVAFFVLGGLAGEIMALTKKQKARRAAIIKILTELSRNDPILHAVPKKITTASRNKSPRCDFRRT